MPPTPPVTLSRQERRAQARAQAKISRRRWAALSGGALIGATGAVLPAAGASAIAPPTLFIVTTLADSTAPGTLRKAVNDADTAGGGTIVFAAGLTGSLPLDSTLGELVISAPLTLTGPGAQLLTVDGGNLTRILHVTSTGSGTSISGLTLSKGNSAPRKAVPRLGAATAGGGVLDEATGTVTLDGVAVTGSVTPGDGGGLAVFGGTLNLVRSSVTGNTANGNGGGLFGDGIAVFSLTDSTIAGNQAAAGGAAYLFGPLALTRSTVTGNTAPVTPGIYTYDNVTSSGTILGGNASGPDLSGYGGLSATYSLVQGRTFPAGSGNLGVSPGALGPLTQAANGTFFALPAASSPTRDAGSPSVTSGVDQRGLPRVMGGRVDMGAVERQQPAITLPAVSSIPAGSPATVSPTVGSPGEGPLTWSVTGALAAGLSLSTATGTLSGTPTQTGTFPLTLGLTDGALADSKPFTLTVTAPPAFTNGAPPALLPGTSVSFPFTASGFPAPTFAVTAGTLPAGLALSPAGVLSGTPTTPGSFPVTVTASNGVAPDASQPVTLTVTAAPVFTNGAPPALPSGAAVSFPFTASGFPAPTFAVTTGTLPAGLALSPAGVLSGTPTTPGSFPVTITASNGVAPDASQPVTLTVGSVGPVGPVGPVGTAPTFTSPTSAAFTAGAPGSLTVTATGSPVPALTVSTGTLPAGLTAVDNGNGTLTLSGTPTTPGDSTLTLTASNGVAPAASQQLTVSVAPVSPVVTSAGSASFVTSLPGSFTVTAGGFPAPSLTLTGLLPAGVSFDPAAGVLAGTPTVAGTFPLTVTADNGTGTPATQAFTLTVVPSAAHKPVLTLSQDVIDVGQGAQLTILGPPGALIRVYAYTRPATTFQRILTIGLNRFGRATATLAPTGDTRIFAIYDGQPASASEGVVLGVRSGTTLHAVGTAPHTFHFTGTVAPAFGNETVRLYRQTTSGLVLAGVALTDPDGSWHVDRHFTGTGLNTFIAVVQRTTSNRAGTSTPLGLTL